MQIRKQIEGILGLINTQEWVAQLLVRLFVGYFFMETGWGKLHNLDAFAQRFVGWGIPSPYFNPALSANTEFFGGWLIFFGPAPPPGPLPIRFKYLIPVPKINFKRRTPPRDLV